MKILIFFFNSSVRAMNNIINISTDMTGTIIITRQYLDVEGSTPDKYEYRKAEILKIEIIP